MRHLWIALGLILWFGACSGAWAACGGSDLVERLASDDPAEHGALIDRAGTVVNGIGRLWRVERQGQPASHLFGTLHIPDGADSVPAEAWEALDAASIAIFELTLDEQARMESNMARNPTMVMDLSAPAFDEIMTPEDVERVTAMFRARGVARRVAERMRPWMQFALLAFPACHLHAVAAGAKPLDTIMAERAGDNGIATLGLETFEEALRGFDDLTREDITRLLIASGRFAEHEEDIYRTALKLYGKGEIALLDKFNLWMSERTMPDAGLEAVNDRLMAGLLDARNAAWMTVLVPELDRGGAFVAVGALHLPGETGLVQMLRDRGYTVTRVSR